MNISQLLKNNPCPCGKEHSCPIQFVSVEPGAIRHLTGLTENYTDILVVADENTYGAAGAQVMKALAGKEKFEDAFVALCASEVRE
jgi:glycerol dehydrogenase-like iron-containing ADH family enzyme